MSKILVVDDDTKLVEALKIRLEVNNYKVMTALNGIEALEKVYKEMPDLVLLDAWLPKMNGWEVCRKIKESEELNSIKVIFLTARTELSNRLIATQILKADGYITKPFESEKLIATIKEVLEENVKEKGISNR
ncbi:MAG: response regulator [bacterium]